MEDNIYTAPIEHSLPILPVRTISTPLELLGVDLPYTYTCIF